MRDVKVPGALVDFVYVDPDQWQTYITRDSPYYAGALRRPVRPEPPLPLDVRKIIARRSLLEFPPGAICNLGFGISQLIGRVAWEEGITDQLTLTVEQGIFGGVPVAGNEGGAGFNYQAMIDQPYMFDFYDGGGLDVASLSFAEVDAEGNVNVHAFEGRIRGPGGFPNISARTGKINFVGTLTAQGLELDITSDGAIGGGQKLLGPGGVPLNVISPPTGDGTSSAKSAASGGGLVSVAVNDATIDYNPTVKSYVSAGQMDAGGSVTIGASSTTGATASTTNAGGGAIGIGVSDSNSNQDVISEAYVDAGARIIAGADFTLSAFVQNNTSNSTNAVTGGLIGVAVSNADSDIDYATSATIKDAIKRARSQLPQGPGLTHCEECGAAIPEARRKAMPGVRLCVPCQEAHDKEQGASSGYNRRGSKDSQLR